MLRADRAAIANGSRTAAGVVLALSIPFLALSAPGSADVAVIGGDGAAIARIIAEAGGDLVGGGRFPGVLVARSDAPGFVHRLYAAGAWLVVHPALAGGCADRRPSPVIPRS